MAKKWSDVVLNPQFQTLSLEEQEAARQQYFADVIVPQVDDSDLDSVRAAFDADTSIASPAPALGKPASSPNEAWASVGYAEQSFAKDHNADKPRSLLDQAARDAGTRADGPPVSAQFYEQVKREFDSASPQKRIEMMQRPGLDGQTASYISSKYELADFAKSQNAMPGIEDMSKRVDTRRENVRRSPDDFTDRYNSSLTQEDEKKFQAWAAENNKLGDLRDYDLRGAYRAIQRGEIDYEPGGHLPDTFKKPNHPTFSNDSKYSIGDNVGGTWSVEDGKDVFTPSRVNLKFHNREQLADYFNKNEPSVALKIDGEKANTATDMLGKAVSGIIEVPKGIVGLVDLAGTPVRAAVEAVTGRYAPTVTETLAALGVDFAGAQKILNEEWRSTEGVRGDLKIADSFDKGWVEGLKELGRNPAHIAGSAIESVPGMMTLAAGARSAATSVFTKAVDAAKASGASAELALAAGREAVEKSMPRLSALSSALEGAQSAGSQAAQVAADGKLDGRQAAAAAIAGLSTALIGQLSNKVGAKFGLDDAEASIGASGMREAGETGLIGMAKAGAKGFIKEGPLEETPQSIGEQMAQNLGDGKPLTEGVAQAGLEGGLVGGLMGASSSVYTSGMDTLRDHLAGGPEAQRANEAAQSALSAWDQFGRDIQPSAQNAPPAQPGPSVQPGQTELLAQAGNAAVTAREPMQRELDAAQRQLESLTAQPPATAAERMPAIAAQMREADVSTYGEAGADAPGIVKERERQAKREANRLADQERIAHGDAVADATARVQRMQSELARLGGAQDARSTLDAVEARRPLTPVQQSTLEAAGTQPLPAPGLISGAGDITMPIGGNSANTASPAATPAVISFTPGDSLSSAIGLTPIVVPNMPARPLVESAAVNRAAADLGLTDIIGGANVSQSNGPAAGIPQGSESSGAVGLGGVASPGSAVADGGRPGVGAGTTDGSRNETQPLANGPGKPETNLNPDGTVDQWLGRRGDGYVTEMDAQQALLGRQRMFKGYNWKVEPMANGRYRLAAYPRTRAAGATNVTTQQQTTPPVATGDQTLGQVAPAAATPAGRSVDPRLTAALPAPKEVTAKVGEALKSSAGVTISSVVAPAQMSEPHRVASAIARLMGKTYTAVKFASIDPKVDPNDFQGFINEEGGKHIFVNANTQNAPLVVTMHEGLHGLPETQRRKLEQSLLEQFQGSKLRRFRSEFGYGKHLETAAAAAKAAGKTLTKEQVDKLKAADVAELRAEIPAIMAEAAASNPKFWTELKDKIGRGEFISVAKHILSKFDQIIDRATQRRGEAFSATYIKDIKKVRSLLADAYAEAIRERTQGTSNGTAPVASRKNSSDRDIGTDLQQRIDSDFGGIVREYSQIAGTDGGRILDADLARELSPEYRADRGRSDEIHAVVSKFIERMLNSRIDAATPGSQIVFMAGGGGSGKTEAQRLLSTQLSSADTIFDGTLSRPEKAVEYAKRVFKNDLQLDVIYVYRDPAEAVRNGVLPRAMRPNGRAVPVEPLVRAHAGSGSSVRKLQEIFGENPKFGVTVIDNSHGFGNAKVSDLQNIPIVIHSGLKEVIENAVQEEFDAGRISKRVYEATLGVSPDAGRVGADPQGQGRVPQGDSREVQGRRGSESVQRLTESAPSSKADVAAADKIESETGFRPYTSEGQIEVPVGIRFSIKSAYSERDQQGRTKKGKDGKEVYVPPKLNHPFFNVPLNKNGTVTLYVPTTNDGARQIMRDKKLRGHSPSATRIHLTNESSASAIAENPGFIEQPVGGANVMVQIDPALLHLEEEHANGRKDFFVHIAEGDAFRAKMKQVKLFTLNKSRKEGISKTASIASISAGVRIGVEQFAAMNAADKRARLKEARAILKQMHNVGTLLGENGKLEKTRVGDYGLTYEGKSVASLGQGLASAQQITDKLSTCPNSALCEALCLGETSGQNELYGGEGPFRSGPRLSQYLKTEALVMHPEDYAILLYSEIDRFRKRAVKEDYQPAIRLNVTSDFAPKVFAPIIKAFDDVQFYDYTKLGSESIAPNHHITYSSTGVAQEINGKTVGKNSNWERMKARLREGSNVAMAFSSKTDMPDYMLDEVTGEKFQVWDGDNYDARFLDPKPGEPGNEFGKGMIIGLTNKDRTTKPEDAAEKHDGFFVNYDRAVDGDTLVVRDLSKPLASRTSRARNPQVNEDLAEAYRRWDDGDSTPQDVLDDVESMDPEDVPADLLAAAETYRNALEEDFNEYGGRGETEPQEEAFLNAVAKYAEAGAPRASRVSKSPLGFYSELGRKLEAGPNVAPKDQWKAYLKGLSQKGVKADEIEWSGVTDWLDLQQGKVSKADVLAYLNANGVQVEETVLGGAGSSFNNMSREDMGRAYERIVGYNIVEEDPSITDDEVRQELQRFATEAGESDGITEDGRPMPKYARYTLPGGTNYREVLLRLPSKSRGATLAEIDKINRRLVDAGFDGLTEDQRDVAQRGGNDAIGMLEDLADRLEIRTDDVVRGMTNGEASSQYRSNHWDQPNILAHIRLNDRTDADGKRVLFVEEVQSDWGQEGKKRGFAEPETKRIQGSAVQSEDGSWRVDWEDGTFSGGYSEASARAKAAEGKSNAKAGVPAAPFVTNTQGWLNLALKRIVTLATSEGYDRVAFANGEQSADRFDLSKEVDSVKWYSNSDNAKIVQIALNNGDRQALAVDTDGVVSSSGGNRLSGKTLDEVIGKELSDRVMTESNGNLSGLDLKVGGEGMKTFYDKIVPNAVRALVKKMGGEPRPVAIGTMRDGPGTTDRESGVVRGPKAGKAEYLSQPGFDVTDKMRSQVAEVGLPQFSRRRDNGNVIDFKEAKFDRQLPGLKASIGRFGQVASVRIPDEATVRRMNRDELFAWMRTIDREIRDVEDDYGELMTDGEVLEQALTMREETLREEENTNNYENGTPLASRQQRLTRLPFDQDPLGRVRFAFGKKVADYVGDLSNVVLNKLRMKPASEELSKNLRKFRAEVERSKRNASDIMSKMTGISEDDAKLISDIIENELQAGVTPAPEILAKAAAITAAMSAQSQELVRLKMLSPVAAHYWDGKYLPRFYEKHLRTQGQEWIKAARETMRRPSKMQGIRGDALKGRGQRKTVSAALVQTYINDGWEIRDENFVPGKSKTVSIFKDWSRDQREAWNEIRDARFRFVMGFLKTQKDIALGRLYERIANDPEMSSDTEQPGMVRVPDAKVEGTRAAKYGMLAGKYVSQEVLDYMSADEGINSNELFKTYKQALALWKEGKTALNPVSHMNNVIGNITMTHMAGIPAYRVDTYATALNDLVRNKPMVQEALDAGLFGDTFNSEELFNSMPADLRALAQRIDSPMKRGIDKTLNVMTMFLRRPLANAYQKEDQLFRYMIYKDARTRGLSVDDAMAHAEKYIFSYNDLPKGAKLLRDTVLPFFSWTYKAVPTLFRTALEYPHRMIMPFVAMYGLNALATIVMSGGDDDDWMAVLEKFIADKSAGDVISAVNQLDREQRENMPDYLKGRTFMGTQKAIRMPWDTAMGMPVYWDVSRIFPGGDFGDVTSNVKNALPFPQQLVPSHPAFNLMAGMMLNMDPYFGSQIVTSADDSLDAARKRGNWAYQQLMPATAVGGYHFDRLMNAAAQGLGRPIQIKAPGSERILVEYSGYGKDGLPVDPGYAMAQTLGIKIKPVDPEKGELYDRLDKEAAIKAVNQEKRRIRRQMGSGYMSTDLAQQKLDDLNRKKGYLEEGLTIDGNPQDD